MEFRRERTSEKEATRRGTDIGKGMLEEKVGRERGRTP